MSTNTCLGWCSHGPCKRRTRRESGYCWQHKKQQPTNDAGLRIRAPNGYVLHLEDNETNRNIVTCIHKLRRDLFTKTISALRFSAFTGDVENSKKIEDINVCTTALHTLQSSLDEYREYFNDEFIRAECSHTQKLFTILNEYKDIIRALEQKK